MKVLCIFRVAVAIVAVLSTIPIDGREGPLIGAWDLSMYYRSLQTLYDSLPHCDLQLRNCRRGGNVGSDRVRLVRHHVISRRKLRTFFNNLINRNHTYKVRRFWYNLENLYSYNEASCEKPQAIHDIRDKFGYFQRIRKAFALGTVVNDPRTRQPSNYEEFQRLLFFAPFNLFVGPSRRSDDPGWNFEVDCKFFLPSVQFKNLLEAASIMEYYEYYINLSDDLWKKLEERLVQLTAFYCPAPFHAEEWQNDGRGSFQIKHTWSSWPPAIIGA